MSTRSGVKCCGYTEKNNMWDKSYILLSGTFWDNFTPNIDFTDKPVVQCDVPVINSTFVDDCK